MKYPAVFVVSFCAGVLGLAPVGALAQQAPTVVIDGSPMAFSDQPPVEQAGRIYVPMRAIFERLGATVVYANGTINATRGHQTIQLQIGSPVATVDGQQMQLDAPPFEIAARTLVPLRFVSQALGARVSWNESQDTAYISTAGGEGMTGGYAPAYPPHGPVPPYQPGTSQQQPGPAWADAGHPLLHRPYPWGTISLQFPLINASFRHPVDPQSIRITLDGDDVTQIAKVTTMGFEFTPAFRLHAGTHSIRIRGMSQDGAPVSDGWNFTVMP